MTVNLRDRLFNDTGGIVQNATVQAILVTGGGTDAGTSSTVQATTTTDVNGVWKFTGLPDPGAGNWYDIKITNGNQIRWRYGNIQSLLNSLQVSNASWQITGLGIGAAPVSNFGILLNAAITASGTVAAGAGINPTLTSSANNDSLYGLRVSPTFADAGHTGVSHIGVEIVDGGLLIGGATPSGITGRLALGTTTASAGAGATATLTTTGGSGPTVSSQSTWLVARLGGNTIFIPAWI